MHIKCPICQKANTLGQNLCSNCSKDLLKINPQKRNGSYCLYKYEKFIRQSIVATKVKNDRRALLALVSLFLENPLTRKIARECDYIMPTPASLWSRCRGRADLAWFLAKSLSLKQQKKILSPPLKLRWRLKKRAQKQRSMQSFDCSGFFQVESSQPKLLLIDDVITTGFTLNKVCLELEGMYNIRILTLAYSR